MRRTLVLFATLVLLWAIVSQANHYLAPVHVHLFVGGLYVVFAALRMARGPGLAAVTLGGLLNDAVTPVPFGTHMLLMMAAFLFIQHVRDRIPREETAVSVFVALIANLGLFMALSFLRIGTLPAPGAAWLRLFFDLLCSQVAIVLVGPWFFALQFRSLQLARAQTTAFD